MTAAWPAPRSMSSPRTTGGLTLLQHPRVVATPHLGAQTVEAQERVALEIVRNVLAALRGEIGPRPRRWTGDP